MNQEINRVLQGDYPWALLCGDALGVLRGSRAQDLLLEMVSDPEDQVHEAAKKALEVYD